MRHPVSRAAAAAISVLAIGGVVLWLHVSGATPAFADFIRPILNAKTVRYKFTIEVTSPMAGTVNLSAETQEDLLKQTAVVMMPDARRCRTETTISGKLARVDIQDMGQGRGLLLDPARKRAEVFHYADRAENKTPKGKDRRPASPQGGPGEPWPVATFRRLLRDVRGKHGVEAEPLGQQEIDGRRVVGFRISSAEIVMTVWGDPKTGFPVRIEGTVATMPYLKITMSDFAINVPMDESLFSVEPPAGYKVTAGQYSTSDDSPGKEKELIEMFRYYSGLSGGRFPDVLDLVWLGQTVRDKEWLAANLGPSHKSMAQREQAEDKVERGMQFAALLPKEADAHYAGKGVSLGAADKPIFWYRPKDAKKYRVIYADLSVREADRPPSVPVLTIAQMEKDLLEMFRQYSQLNEGTFPDLLDEGSFLAMVSMQKCTEDQLQKPDKPSARQEQGRAQAWAKLQQGLIFIGLLPKEADVHYAGNGVSLGTADRPIFWYRPKDAKAYRVVYADLSVRDAETPPNLPVAQPEQALIEMLRHYSELFGGALPNSLEQSLIPTLSAKLSMKILSNGEQQPSAKQEQEIIKATMKFIPGLTFAASLSLLPDTDAHYAGRGVSLGAADKPIFWYRPKDSKKYRVIYGDLSVRDAGTPPSVPAAPPEQDLIDALRCHHRELGGGTFPDSLDMDGFCDQFLEKKLGLQKEHEPNAKQMHALGELQLKFLPGLVFAASLSPEADAHYAGKGVKFGAVNAPIFWHRPKDSKKYRVIYADLSVREAGTPPNVPNAQPVPGPSLREK
jgi:hypothetical protein